MGRYLRFKKITHPHICYTFSCASPFTKPSATALLSCTAVRPPLIGLALLSCAWSFVQVLMMPPLMEQDDRCCATSIITPCATAHGNNPSLWSSVNDACWWRSLHLSKPPHRLPIHSSCLGSSATIAILQWRSGCHRCTQLRLRIQKNAFRNTHWAAHAGRDALAQRSSCRQCCCYCCRQR